MPHNYVEKIDEFIQRIQKRMEQSTTPAALSPFIQFEHLRDIYGYLIKNKATLKRSRLLQTGKSVRLDKRKTKLARTLNFIFDYNGNIALILETKRKNKDEKDPHIPTFSGSYKTTKPAWRIDGEFPQKMSNAVFYMDDYFSTTEYWLSEAEKETQLAQNVVDHHQENDTYIHSPILGKVIEKKGLRKKDDAQIKYSRKISFYSPWAEHGDLTEFLNTKEYKALSPEQVWAMAKQLIIAIKSLHEAGIIHQDIKTDNILVFTDENGNYRLELTDFGIACDTNKENVSKLEALASPGYESPEISLAYQETTARLHKTFHNEKHSTFAKKVLKLQEIKAIPEYAFPHKANDAWALGIVLSTMFKDQGKVPPLIIGLLNPNRDKRATPEQILAALEPPKEQMAPLAPSKHYHPNFDSLEIRQSPPFWANKHNIRNENKGSEKKPKRTRRS